MKLSVTLEAHRGVEGLAKEKPDLHILECCVNSLTGEPFWSESTASMTLGTDFEVLGWMRLPPARVFEDVVRPK